MAGILGNWRNYSYTAMAALVALGGFTLLHHPDFAAKRLIVEQSLAHVSMPQLRSQLRMPIAIGQLLVPGIKGCFCSVLLFGLLAGQGQQLHSYGSTFLQDVFLPFIKKPLSAKAHVRALKLMVFGVAIFACLFSMWFKPVDYLILATALLGSLYMGGIGLVVWGGLYSRKATNAAAWTSLLIGSISSAIFFIFQQYWADMHPTLLRIAGSGALGQYIAAHPVQCPMNGQILSVITAVSSATGFILVSFLTYKKNFNLDEMLHRGKYSLNHEDGAVQLSSAHRSWLARFLDINEHFTRGDKVITYGTFAWSVVWQLIAIDRHPGMDRLSSAGFLPSRGLTTNSISSSGFHWCWAVPTTVWVRHRSLQGSGGTDSDAQGPPDAAMLTMEQCAITTTLKRSSRSL